MKKLSRAQGSMLVRLLRSDDGIPLDGSTTPTLEALVRRGLVAYEPVGQLGEVRATLTEEGAEAAWVWADRLEPTEQPAES